MCDFLGQDATGPLVPETFVRLFFLAHFLHIVEMMEEYGPALGKPYTDSMGDGLFEIRAKGKEGIGRSLFCTTKGQEIIILHSFIKKSQKTPKKEIDLARKRMKEVKQP